MVCFVQFALEPSAGDPGPEVVGYACVSYDALNVAMALTVGQKPL